MPVPIPTAPRAAFSDGRNIALAAIRRFRSNFDDCLLKASAIDRLLDHLVEVVNGITIKKKGTKAPTGSAADKAK
jgi:hypothetical protein